MNAINKILLNRKQAVSIKPIGAVSIDSSNKVLALIADISQLGYTLDGDVINVLKTFDDESLAAFHSMLVTELKVMIGSHVRYVPLIKSFPYNIPNDNELFVKKIIGYFQNYFQINPKNYSVLSCGHTVSTVAFDLDNYSCCPLCEKQLPELMAHEERDCPVENTVQFKVIKLVNEDVINDIFVNLLTAKTSISVNDKDDVSSIISILGVKSLEILPEKIDQKETLAFLVDTLMKKIDVDFSLLSKYFKTSTDVLRLAVQFSEGDVSLAAKTRFKLKNKERKIVMKLLNDVFEPEVDMLRYREEWIRLGEVLHAGSFAKKYPVAAVAFHKIRNEASLIETFSRKVESLINSAHYSSKNDKEIKELIALLSTRAGEYARRLDHMMRIAEHPSLVVTGFRKIVSDVKTPMLLTIMKHIQNRENKKEFRSFIPKGQMAKVQFFKGDGRDTLLPLHIKKIVKMITDELLSRFGKMDSLGTVLINKNETDKVLVPSSQRSASKSLINLPRGSRIKITDGTPFLRLFTYWKSNVDVDLSASLLDENFNCKSTLSYYNLKSFGRSVHSGDIRNGSHGAVEFIDLDLEAFREKNIKYVSVNVFSYSGEPFSDYECFAGFMERQDTSARQFDATTVRHKFDIVSKSRNCIPMVFDIENMEVIWLDLINREDNCYGNYLNTRATVNQSILAGMDMLNNKTTLLELFELHAKARATTIHYERVEGVEYDHVFDLEKLKDLDEIMSKYLS